MQRKRAGVGWLWLLSGFLGLWCVACEDGNKENSEPLTDGDISVDGDLDWEHPSGSDREWPEAESEEEEPFVPPPWEAPAGTWTTCPDVSLDQSLSETAAFYDWIVPVLHQAPFWDSHDRGLGLVYSVESCQEAIPTEEVNHQAIPKCRFVRDDRAGLWTSLYVASQAYRLAVTGDDEARQQLVKGLNSLNVLMSIAGEDGLLSRQFVQPGFYQEKCPSEDEDYQIPSDEMDTRPWVRVSEDGSLEIYSLSINGGGAGFEAHEDYTTDASYAGFCFQRNADKYDLAGLLFALGVTAHVVPEPEIIGLVQSMALRIGNHLLDHDYALLDYDGKATRDGGTFSQAVDAPTGFNALLALSFLKTAAMISEDNFLRAEYENCLLQSLGKRECIDQPGEEPKSYQTYLNQMGLKQGCSTDYEQVGVAALAYQNLIWWETDAELRAGYREAFHQQTSGEDIDFRNLWQQQNVMLNMILVAMMENPDSQTLAEAESLMADAVCMLKRFPQDYRQTRHDNSALDIACISGLYGPLAEESLSVGDRCPEAFAWWSDPARIDSCQEDDTKAFPPTGFLLPYWMGRYFGFLDETL